MNDENKFSIRIKRLRQESDMSQEELGKLVGVSKVSVWQWENGINYPNNNILLSLSDYFKVSTDYLLGKSDIRNNDAVDMDSFQVAFYNETKEMSEEMKNQVLDYVRFLRNKK